jgi:hypothetical protein
MKLPFTQPLKRSFQSLNQWLFQTPERALDQAYDAALIIKAMEDEHFGGGKISPDGMEQDQGRRVYRYFQDELQKYLGITRVRLAEFKTSRSILSLTDPRLSGINFQRWAEGNEETSTPDRLAIRLEKLRFVDEVLERYQPKNPVTALVSLNNPPAVTRPVESANRSPYDFTQNFNPSRSDDKVEDITQGNPTSYVPRSILGTIARLRRELDPQAEEEVVKNFRSSKTKTVLSLRFILLLILVPLLTHQISKNFIVGPIVEDLRPNTPQNLFLNIDMEEEALSELERFEHRLEFQSLLYNAPALSAEEKEEKIHLRAEEIAKDYYDRGENAIKNIFSDLVSTLAFVIVLLISKRDIVVLKSFLDDIIYGLSDSAKAFIIILFTDIFVGFHSPHGWEVLLEGVSRHFGLPESREFIYLFIATFPVILDTVFKYWIFRYLNRISPSAVATYRNMNE